MQKQVTRETLAAPLDEPAERGAPPRVTRINEKISGKLRGDFEKRLFLSTLQSMRVLGIDCGGEYTGFGIVEQDDSGKLNCICFGAVRLKTREPLARRLLQVYRELTGKIAEHHPDMVAIEDVFYAVNAKSALKLGQVRGVAMLSASSCGLEVAEYAPLAIKSAVVGYGRAEKAQVQEMVMRLLGLEKRPEPPDAADALAIAVCHLHTWATLKRQGAAR